MRSNGSKKVFEKQPRQSTTFFTNVVLQRGLFLQHLYCANLVPALTKREANGLQVIPKCHQKNPEGFVKCPNGPQSACNCYIKLCRHYEKICDLHASIKLKKYTKKANRMHTWCENLSTLCRKYANCMPALCRINCASRIHTFRKNTQSICKSMQHGCDVYAKPCKHYVELWKPTAYFVQMHATTNKTMQTIWTCDAKWCNLYLELCMQDAHLCTTVHTVHRILQQLIHTSCKCAQTLSK